MRGVLCGGLMLALGGCALPGGVESFLLNTDRRDRGESIYLTKKKNKVVWLTQSGTDNLYAAFTCNGERNIARIDVFTSFNLIFTKHETHIYCYAAPPPKKRRGRRSG